MKLLSTLIINLVFIAATQSQFNIELKELIDDFVKEAMSEYGIPGVSLAVVQGNELIHRADYGLANIEHNVPVKEHSIFRVYSITKIFVATAVFKLVEEGMLDLEDSLEKFDLDIPSSWQERQIKHLLSHSSGFPDMSPIPEFQDLSEEEARAKVFQKPISFDAGSRYSYNQTNFYLLQKIVENVTGEFFNNFVLQHQFDSSNGEAFFSMDSREIIKNRVTPYFPFETGKRTIEHPYLKGNYFAACNGMNITMDAFLEWDLNLKNDKLLKKETKDQMFEDFKYSDSEKKFAYSWDKRVLNGHVSYGFSGSLVSAYRIFPEDDISIIFLGNGLGAFFDIEDLINGIANLVDSDIRDLESEYIESLLFKLDQEGFAGYEGLLQDYYKREGDEDIEGISNSIGYHLLSSGELTEALQIFQLNVELFPNSWNVYDSLGEAYLAAGKTKDAKINYEKSLRLNPGNINGQNVLRSLE